MSTGYLTPYEAGKTRNQVVVVVTDGLTVLCFSNTLKLEWESTIDEYIESGTYISEVASIVLPNSILIGDEGSVVIGSRFSHVSKPKTDTE